jgi:hypothetical protein
MAQDRYGDWRDRDRDYGQRGPQGGREDFGRGGEQRSFGPERPYQGGAEREAWGRDERGGVAMGTRDVGGYYGYGEDEFGRDEYRSREGGVFSGADYRGAAGRELARAAGRYGPGYLGPDVGAVREARIAQARPTRQGEHRGHGPRGYRRSDERIREDVCDRLTDDSHLDARNLEVEVRHGEVILNGTVERREDKRRAEILAERCSGVENVQNNLRAQRNPGEGPRQAGGQGGERWRPSPG